MSAQEPPHRDIDAYFETAETRFKRSPYVCKVLDFGFDDDAEPKEGWIEFHGHFYEDDEAFPLKYFMFIWETELLPYKKEGATSHFRKLWEIRGRVEIFRREHLAEPAEKEGDCTLQEKRMDASFFYVNRQKIWFRVLEMSPAGVRELAL